MLKCLGLCRQSQVIEARLHAKPRLRWYLYQTTGICHDATSDIYHTNRGDEMPELELVGVAKLRHKARATSQRGWSAAVLIFMSDELSGMR